VIIFLIEKEGQGGKRTTPSNRPAAARRVPSNTPTVAIAPPAAKNAQNSRKPPMAEKEEDEVQDEQDPPTRHSPGRSSAVPPARQGFPQIPREHEQMDPFRLKDIIHPDIVDEVKEYLRRKREEKEKEKDRNKWGKR